MKTKSKPEYTSIEEYVAAQEEEVRKRLALICEVIHEVVPEAQGRISYEMPAFFYRNDRLVYFCAFKKHIGFYPASMTVFAKFKQDLKGFKQSGRGTVQFSYAEELPIGLIRRIVRFRVKENKDRSGRSP